MNLHFGCGTNYINGWVNVDLDAPLADIHHDLTCPLPYDDASVNFIFSEHFLEHITREEGLALLRECRRVLKPGGVFRVSTPDLRWLVAQYVSGKLDEWDDVGWVPRGSCQLLNEGMRSWGHQFVYDSSELLLILQEAGFTGIAVKPYRESAHAELAGLECRPWHQELIMEAY